MAVFRWEGISPKGEVMRGEMEATTRDAVIVRLRTQRIQPLPAKIREKGRGLDRQLTIPGLGMIQEVDDLSRAMAKLWMGEAMAYQGRRVALSIMNSRVPITGTLVDLTQDGLLIDQDGGGEVAVSYSRLSGIDAA